MKPILFNTEMVRAILEGRKTVTRRVVKYRGCDKETHPVPTCTEYTGIHVVRHTWETAYSIYSVFPQYQPGDILYVRETFFEYKGKYEYKADGKHLPLNSLIGGKEFFKWRPSVHMPKEAARIFLRVTDVRVERLQDITNEDILREGVIPEWERIPRRRGENKNFSKFCCDFHTEDCLDKPCANRDAYERMCHQKPFSELWNSTVKPADHNRYGWEANTWVWVIRFERISKEEALHEQP